MDSRLYASLGASEQPSPSLSAPKSYLDTSHHSYAPYSYQKESTPKHTTEYTPHTYTNDIYSSSSYLKEVPKSATLPYRSSEPTDMASLLNTYTSKTSITTRKENKNLQGELKALAGLKDQMKQQQSVIKSSMFAFVHEMQRNIKSLQSEIERLNRMKGVEIGRVKQEKDDFEFQRNALREDSERLTRKNEELRIQFEQVSRNLERKEKEHQADLEKFKQLYDEMIRNISEEKKRAINKLTAEMREKEIAYQQRAGSTTYDYSSGDLSASRRSEPQEKAKSSYRHVEDVVHRGSAESEELVRELAEIKTLLSNKEKDLELERSIRQEIEVQREKQMKLVEELEKEVHLLRQRAEVSIEGENKIDIEAFKKQENERAQRYEERIKELEETLTRLSGLASAHEEVHKDNKEGELREEVERLRNEAKKNEDQKHHDREELHKLREYVVTLEAQLKSEQGLNAEQGQQVTSNVTGELLERQKSKRREYKKQLTAAKDDLAKGQKEKEEISQKLYELEKEMEKWSLIEEDRKKVLAEAQEAAEIEKRQREEASLKLSEIEGKMENLRGKKKEYKTQLSQVQEKATTEQQEKDQVAEKAREYEQEIERQNSRLEEYKKLIMEAQELANQEKQRKEESLARIAGLEETVNKYKNKKKNYKSKLVETQAAAGTEKPQENNEEYQRELRETREKNEHLANDLRQLQENVKQMEKMLENYKEIEENYQKTLAAVKAEAEEAKRKNEEIATKEAALEERAQKQGEKKKAYKKQLSSVQETAVQEQEKMKELEKELQKLKEKQDNYESELGEAKKKVEEESHTKAHLLSTKEEYERDLAETRKSFKEAEEREKNLLAKIKQFEESMKESQTWTEKYREIEGKYKKIEEELEQAKTQIEKRDLEVEKWKQEATQKGGHLESSKTKAEGAEQTVERLKVELAEAQDTQNKEKHKFEERIKELEKELANATSASKANKEEGKQNKKVNQLETEKKQLENSLKEVTTEKNQLEAKLKKELEAVQNELKEAHKKLEEADKAKAASAEDEKNGFVTRERGVVEHSRQTHEVEGSRLARLNVDVEDQVPRREKERRSAAPPAEHDQEKEELRKRLTEVDTVYGQKIQEMENELASKEQHINALKYDVEQMKEWIVVRHGDEVFEQDSSHNNIEVSSQSKHEERYEVLENSLLSEKASEEPSARQSASVPNKSSLGTEKTPQQGEKKKRRNVNKQNNLSLNWKGRLEESNVVYVPKNDSLHISTTGARSSDVKGIETPRSIKTTESIRTPESNRKGGKGREREGGPAYQALEKMIMELNEKLANAEKKAKTELSHKMHELTLSFQSKEDKHAEEMEKLREEKKVLEEKLNNIQWEHAFELNNLLQKEKAEREALIAKQQAETAPGQGKKKKKKGGS